MEYLVFATVGFFVLTIAYLGINAGNIREKNN